MKKLYNEPHAELLALSSREDILEGSGEVSGYGHVFQWVGLDDNSGLS